MTESRASRNSFSKVKMTSETSRVSACRLKRDHEMVTFLGIFIDLQFLIF